MLRHERLLAAVSGRRLAGAEQAFAAALSAPPFRSARSPRQQEREVERHLAISMLGHRLGPTLCDRGASAVYVKRVIARSGLMGKWARGRWGWDMGCSALGRRIRILSEGLSCWVERDLLARRFREPGGLGYWSLASCSLHN
jgi:hypothetical protein